jgi:hypothetical protein
MKPSTLTALLILFILAVFLLTARLMWVTVHCIPFESGC